MQWKLHPDAVKNASRCSICYVPTQQKLRPDVVKDTSGRNFRSVLVVIKERLFLTSSDPLVSFKWASLELYVDYSPSRKKCPKNVPHFGHSAPLVRATRARCLFSWCPSLVPWVPTWWSRIDRLMVSDRISYVLLFLIIIRLVNLSSLILCLYCHSLHTGSVDAKVFI